MWDDDINERHDTVDHDHDTHCSVVTMCGADNVWSMISMFIMVSLSAA